MLCDLCILELRDCVEQNSNSLHLTELEESLLHDPWSLQSHNWVQL